MSRLTCVLTLLLAQHARGAPVVDRMGHHELMDWMRDHPNPKMHELADSCADTTLTGLDLVSMDLTDADDVDVLGDLFPGVTSLQRLSLKKALILEREGEAERRLSAVTDTSMFNQNVSALKAALLDGYDMTTPPEGVSVRVQLSLQQIGSLDAASQTITFTGWWRHYWTDPRLEWHPASWGGTDMITMKGAGNSAVVWAPDDLVYETMDSTEVVEDIDFTISSDGSVFVSFVKITTVACDMDLTTFPYDTQSCPFTLGSWSYPGSMIDILPRLDSTTGDASAVTLDSFGQSTDYKLTKVRSHAYNSYYSCCPDSPYPIIVYEVVVAREPLTCERRRRDFRKEARED